MRHLYVDIYAMDALLAPRQRIQGGIRHLAIAGVVSPIRLGGIRRGL